MANKDLTKAKLATLVTILIGLNTALLGSISTDKVKTNQMTVGVVDVIDGDTFVTNNGQRVRLLSVDAAEMGRCMSKEAKVYLEKTIEGKQVVLDDVRADKYGRLLALVYLKDDLVNEEMLVNGLARFDGTKSQERDVLKEAYDKARQDKIGLFDKCYQEDPEDEKCSIKGNIDKTTGRKMYHFPGCREYVTTVVELDLGEHWFCSEKEAVEAGYVKSKNCPN